MDRINRLPKASVLRSAVPFLALVLISCISVSQAFAQSSGAARSDGSVTLGWVKSTANLMAFIAPDLSAKRGLKIESANFNTAVDISTAMISGQVDIGLLTPIHLIRAIDTKLDYVQISGNTRGNTGIVAAKKLGLKQDDWAGLKTLLGQKKLRVASSRGSINDMLAIMEFSKHGISVEKDLDWVNIANFAQHPQALRSGDFDLIVTLEPLVSIPIVEGFGTLFSNPYDTPAGDLNTDYVVRRDWLSQNADKAQAFVATLAEAAQHLTTDKQAELQAATKLTGLKPDVLSMALANSHYVLGNGLRQMQALATIAAELKYSSRDVAADLPNHVDDRFLKAVGVSD